MKVETATIYVGLRALTVSVNDLAQVYVLPYTSTIDHTLFPCFFPSFSFLFFFFRVRPRLHVTTSTPRGSRCTFTNQRKILSKVEHVNDAPITEVGFCLKWYQVLLISDLPEIQRRIARCRRTIDPAVSP